MSRAYRLEAANARQLAAEVAAAHGWPDASGITVRAAGLLDGDGRVLPPALAVAREDVDPILVLTAIERHVPDPRWVGDDRDRNSLTLQDQARQTLDTNRTYLARQSPTAAQTTAQVRALTQECSALIRLVLGALEQTD